MDAYEDKKVKLKYFRNIFMLHIEGGLFMV